ncbi:MAG: hypothetical protein V1746_03105 [bacterium]
MNEIVRHFEVKIKEWYINPAEALSKVHDSGFCKVAITCLLIDTLSQYYYGREESGKEHFIEFLNKHFPKFKKQFPQKQKISFRYKELKELKTYSEVIYTGFRCGILHQAHAPLYCAISNISKQTKNMPTNFIQCDTSGSLVKYRKRGVSCPCVILDPNKFFEGVKRIFGEYIKNLLNSDSQHDKLRKRFKRKFENSYGIDVKNFPL